MDEDGSGLLESHEVQALCSQLHQLVPVQLSQAEMASAVQRLDRDNDGTVDFAEFFTWYEQEMTEAKMRDRPLYSEVKAMFSDMDADGSGELDIGAIIICLAVKKLILHALVGFWNVCVCSAGC